METNAPAVVNDAINEARAEGVAIGAAVADAQVEQVAQAAAERVASAEAVAQAAVDALTVTAIGARLDALEQRGAGGTCAHEAEFAGLRTMMTELLTTVAELKGILEALLTEETEEPLTSQEPSVTPPNDPQSAGGGAHGNPTERNGKPRRNWI